mmetsp:Transcript_45498/g.51567  ORF Transcript_45498/g.51567 Transcript_45498/m.51567 type:complete len:113 (-) Transcript_45498:345-683(-)
MFLSSENPFSRLSHLICQNSPIHIHILVVNDLVNAELTPSRNESIPSLHKQQLTKFVPPVVPPTDCCRSTNANSQKKMTKSISTIHSKNKILTHRSQKRIRLSTGSRKAYSS